MPRRPALLAATAEAQSQIDHDTVIRPGLSAAGEADGYDGGDVLLAAAAWSAALAYRAAFCC